MFAKLESGFLVLVRFETLFTEQIISCVSVTYKCCIVEKVTCVYKVNLDIVAGSWFSGLAYSVINTARTFGLVVGIFVATIE